MAAYAEEMLAHWQDGEVRDIHQEMMQLTMRIVAKVLFSVEVKEDTERVAGALNAADAPHFRRPHDSCLPSCATFPSRR